MDEDNLFQALLLGAVDHLGNQSCITAATVWCTALVEGDLHTF